MPRILCLVLSIFMVLPQQAIAAQAWTKEPLNHIGIFKKNGALAYVQELEKGMGEALIKSDKDFVTQVFSKSYRLDPPAFPKITETEKGLEVSLSPIKALIEMSPGVEENSWTLNGKKLETKDKNIEELTHVIWKLLSSEYELGPYPSLKSKQSSFFWNLFLPRAEASLGTVLGVMVAVAAIAGIVYYVNKTTKATKRAIDRAGASVERGVNTVSNSAANAINKVGDSASNLINRTSDLTDKASKTLDAHSQQLNTHTQSGN